MKDFLTKKKFAYKNNLNNILEKKKQKVDKTTFAYNIIKKRGLVSTLRELVTYTVLDKMLRYDYRYEYSYFKETEAFKTVDGYIKYISKTVDTKFDVVFNDLEAKHYNGFKTFITINTKIYKFIRSFEKMRPLQKISLFTKRLEGLYPKQKEFYNLTGGNRNYYTTEIITDLTEKTSTFSNIFTCFTYLKTHIISVLSNINHLVFKNLFKTVFVTLNYKRSKYTVFLNGFTAIFKKRLYRFKYYIPYKVFKIMDKSELPKRTFYVKRCFKIHKITKHFLQHTIGFTF